MDPVAHAFGASPGHVLGNLALMVGEHEIHSSSVNIELLSEIFLTHN